MIVDINNPNLVFEDLDSLGQPMYTYNGVWLTGIIREYYTNNGLPTSAGGVYTSLVCTEMSYKDGYEWGLQTSYYENGQMESQWVTGEGGFDGLWQEWDEQGNLTYSKMWIKGDEQP